MNELSKFLVESILEEQTGIENIVVVYPGRFQPFHKGHYQVFKYLQKEFGSKNVFIGTSNKTDNKKSPFNFKEKVEIMTKLHNVPKNKIVQIKNPYAPKEILKKFDEDTTAFITVVGKKDASRLGGKYFEPYKEGKELQTYKEKGYVFIAPNLGKGISGTETRNAFKNPNEEEREKFAKREVFTKWNNKTYQMVVDKIQKLPEISERRTFIPKEVIENWLVEKGTKLIESSFSQGSDAVDDGPNFFFPNFETFDKISKDRAEEIGYQVLDQIMSGELTDIDDHPIYPKGPVKAVTPYPAGVIGRVTATNQKDYTETEAYRKWYNHVTRPIALVGYSVVNDLDVSGFDKFNYDDIDTTAGNANDITENINIPVKVGDTILTGRFKNKKTVVKNIGKDEHGMPTINGRKVVNFRTLKEGVYVKLDEIPMSDLQKIDTYADKQLNPVDVVLTDKHFFDRLQDTRNKKEITQAELIGFFKRLGKNKKKFVDFLNKYGQIVAKDNRTKLNIPFMKRANQVIAKTVMRKDNFKTSSPEYKFENINKRVDEIHMGYPSQDDLNKLEKELKRLRTKFDKEKKDLNFDKSYAIQEGEIDAGEPETGYLPDGKKRKLGKRSGRPEPWFDQLGYEQVDFPKADRMRGKGKGRDTESAFRKVTYKTKNVKVSALKKALKPVGSNEWPEVVKESVNEVSKKEYKDALINLRDEIKKGKGEFGYEATTKMYYQNAGKMGVKNKFIDNKTRLAFNRYNKKNMGMSSLSGGNKFNDVYADGLDILINSINEVSKKEYQEKLLNEGGAYGHMNHPFDKSVNLTFGDLKNIVEKALTGELNLAREKTDGQALAISWRDDKGLIAARNKSHLKNKGENALDVKGVATKFKGRGELEKAYNFAMRDLKNAVSSLSDKQKKKIFKDGSCFMNLEVIYPTSVNVIPYGAAFLVFHGTMEYDIDGNAIGENQEAARILAGMIKQVEKHIQTTYTIQGPPVLELPKTQNLSSKKTKYNGMISKLQKEFRLKDNDGVAEYHQAWWTDWIKKNTPKKLDNTVFISLVKRWAFDDKSFRLNGKNIEDLDVLQWAQKTDKMDKQRIEKENLNKFEKIFLGLGADVLEFVSSVLVVSPDKATRAIKDRVVKSIKDIRAAKDPSKIRKLEVELKRLQQVGGLEKIVPVEGIVFVYKGKTMKLTGSFASVNQLLGLMYY